MNKCVVYEGMNCIEEEACVEVRKNWGCPFAVPRYVCLFCERCTVFELNRNACAISSQEEPVDEAFFDLLKTVAAINKTGLVKIKIELFKSDESIKLSVLSVVNKDELLATVMSTGCVLSECVIANGVEEIEEIASLAKSLMERLAKLQTESNKLKEVQEEYRQDILGLT